MWDKMADRTDLMEKLDRLIKASELAEEAFVSICPLVVLFGKKEEQLQLRPSEMADELLGYLEEQEEGDMKEQEEKLGRRRNILACYCKLVMMELLPAKYFNRVLSRYNISFLQFGDIITLCHVPA